MVAPLNGKSGLLPFWKVIRWLSTTRLELYDHAGFDDPSSFNSCSFWANTRPISVERSRPSSTYGRDFVFGKE